MIYIVIGIVLIVAALFLIIAVLMQSAKNSRMSGVVAGGSETFFGKQKGKTIDKKLNTLTIIVAIVFVVLCLVLYIVQPGKGKVNYGDLDVDKAAQDAAVTTLADNGDTTEVPATTEAPAVTGAEN